MEGKVNEEPLIFQYDVWPCDQFINGGGGSKGDAVSPEAKAAGAGAAAKAAAASFEPDIPLHEKIRQQIKRKNKESHDGPPKAKGQKKNTENLIVKSAVQKEFGFPVSSRSSADTYTVTVKVIDGNFMLECNCGSKFKMQRGRSNCIHCMSVLLNLVGNTMNSVSKKNKRYLKLMQFHKELANILDES